MLSLSLQQMKIVQQAAALLPINARDAFLRSVAGRLTDIENSWRCFWQGEGGGSLVNLKTRSKTGHEIILCIVLQDE